MAQELGRTPRSLRGHQRGPQRSAFQFRRTARAGHGEPRRRRTGPPIAADQGPPTEAALSTSGLPAETVRAGHVPPDSRSLALRTHHGGRGSLRLQTLHPLPHRFPVVLVDAVLEQRPVTHRGRSDSGRAHGPSTGGRSSRATTSTPRATAATVATRASTTWPHVSA
uniref:Uncharacterized protein n=1 Tax=uncultured marine virus TaxID=186617 RepID=A0A0F7L7U1_9VIRU|nr:hypothetical protein [uncultured marine virus]